MHTKNTSLISKHRIIPNLRSFSSKASCLKLIRRVASTVPLAVAFGIAHRIERRESAHTVFRPYGLITDKEKKMELPREEKIKWRKWEDGEDRSETF